MTVGANTLSMQATSPNSLKAQMMTTASTASTTLCHHDYNYAGNYSLYTIMYNYVGKRDCIEVANM